MPAALKPSWEREAMARQKPASPAPELVLKRSEKAWQRKAPMLSLLQDAYRYAMPDRDTISSHAPGAQRNLQAYDSTAIVGTLRFANRIQTDLFPPYRKWCTLEAGSAIPEDQKADTDKELERRNEKLFRFIHESSFDTALNEALQDLAAGTGVLLIENGRMATKRPGGKLFRVQALPSSSVAFEEGPFGLIEGYYHKRKVKHRDIKRVFPKGEFPAWVAGVNDPDFEIEFHVCAYYDAELDAFWNDVVMAGSQDGKGGHRVQASTSRTSPFIAFRWTKAAGEVEGRGPLLMALPDIKTLNKVVELILKNASLAVAGVYTAVDDGVINPATVRLAPGTIIPVGSNGGNRGRSLDLLPVSGNFNVAELVIEKMQMQIKTHLFDKALPPDTGPVRSPTEIVQRIKELQTDTGAPFGRLIVELQVPVVQRFLDIADKAGEIPMELNVDGREVAIKPTSPLARGAALEDVQAIADYVSLAAPFGEDFLATGLEKDKTARFLARAIGVPRMLIPGEEEVAERRASERQAAEAEQLAASPVAAKVVEQVGAGVREQAGREAEATA
jgi:hypothetical protein